MTFTALHLALGVGPGPLSSELLDQAVSAGVAETTNLDWKSSLPPAKGLVNTDFPKDVAAMANSGGGLIVYGVDEEGKAATERLAVRELSENDERSLHQAAVTAISPPVFGLNVHRLGDDGNRAVAIEVPASVDGPHLIYKNELFGAPIRNDADTVWMKERQIEAMYRARFNERRHALEALEQLYDEASAGRDVHERAWLIGVAHPRLPRVGSRLTRAEAQAVFAAMSPATLEISTSKGTHPLEHVDGLNPRAGLRRWNAPNSAKPDRGWCTAAMSVHHDGSVSVAAALGGHRITQTDYLRGWQARGTAVEAAVADLLGLVRATASATSRGEYDVRVGIEWTGVQDLVILDDDARLSLPIVEGATALPAYSPVTATIDAGASGANYHRAAYELVEDCLNQGGLTDLVVMKHPG